MKFCGFCGTKVQSDTVLCSFCNSEGKIADVVETDFSKYESDAYSGDGNAMFLTALGYLEGIGVEKDVYSAFYWMKQAAQKNITAAMYQLSLMYENGLGVVTDSFEAKSWLEKYNGGKAERMDISDKKTEPINFSGDGLEWFDGSFSTNTGFESPQIINSDVCTESADNENFSDEEILKDDENESFSEASDEIKDLIQQADEMIECGDTAMDEQKDDLLAEYDRKAAELYTKAAKAGRAEAYINLAWMCLRGRHFEKSLEMALYYLNLAKKCTDYEDCTLFGYSVHFGIYLDPDFVSTQDALELLEEALEYDYEYCAKIFVDAMNDLGPFADIEGLTEEDCEILMYKKTECASIVAHYVVENGEDEDEDMTEEYIMSYLICLAEVFPDDVADEVLCFSEYLDDFAEDEENQEFLLELAEQLDEYRDDKNRMRAAFAIYTSLADAGHIYSQFMTGFYYDFGLGTKVDHAEANNWYETASNNGSPQASFNLGYNLDNGIGSEIDVGRAMVYYRLAGERGNPNGYFNLGVCCEVEGDLLEAARAYKLAMQSDDSDNRDQAKKRYKEVCSKLSFVQKMSL